MSEFGQYIKKIREERGLTINQVATYSGISAAQLSRIENGKRGVPKPPTIAKIAKALKVDYEELMAVAGYIEEVTEEIHTSLSDKAEKDIAKRLEKFKEEIENSDGLAFSGEPLSEEAKESLIESMEYIFRQTQKLNKKYIPKKCREGEENGE